MTPRIGIVLFPGSNRDIDAVNAVTLAGAEPVIAVARVRRPRGRRRDPAAGRLRVRRLPARRRHRAVQPGHARGRGLRRPRRAGARDLQRVPGAGGGRAGAGRAAAQPRACASCAARSRCCPSTSTRRSPASSTAGALRMPVAHGEGCYYGDEATLDALERDGRVLWRYANPDGSVAGPDDRGNPNGSLRGIAGVRNAAGNVAGLMPHPETASRGAPRVRRRPRHHPLARGERGRVASTGSITGASGRRAPQLSPGSPGDGHGRRAAAPRPRARGRRARRDPREAGPRPERPRARHVQRHVERALLVQDLAAAARDAPDRGRATSSPVWASRRA